MSKSSLHALIWSEEHQCYELTTGGYFQQSFGQANERAWLSWMQEQTAFAFEGRGGHLSVIKEARSRGAGYWYAYSRRTQRTRKRYLGRTTTVTLARLEEVAQSLMNENPAPLLPPALLEEEGVFQATTPRLQEEGKAREGIPSSSSSLPREQLDPKFRLPGLPASLIERAHLTAHLDAGFARKLTLIAAPAGFGKTTLVRAWIASRMTSSMSSENTHQDLFPVAWVALDERDNDPLSFWGVLLAACQRWFPPRETTTLELLRTRQYQSMLTTFLRELSSLATRRTLVLEDYHVITSPHIHEMVVGLLARLPATLHLLFTTRADPPLPLARLRANGELQEIRADDLRFALTETQVFLQQALPFPLDASASKRMHLQTEGWVTGLRMLTLALQACRSQQESGPLLASFSGTHRYILEYLVEEVLTAQPDALQLFLLQTSGLNRLTASLCDAVTGRNNSDLLLEQVERANLFLQPLDGSQQWYRYHALWAQAMQWEARRRLGEATVRTLSVRASQWYEQQRLLPEAIEAALRGEDFSHATTLIERFVDPNSFRNAYSLICSWLRRIPDEVLQAQPELCFQAVEALMITTDRRSSATWTRSEQLLQWAEQGFEAREQWERRGDALQLHAVLAFFQEDLMHLFALAHQAQPLLTERSLMYPHNLLSRGCEALLAGEVQVAWQYFREAYEQVKNLGDHAAAFGAALFLGEVCLEKGELRRASHYSQQALAHVDADQEFFRLRLLLETGDAEPFFLSWAYHSLARLAYERNELADARRSLSQALVLREKPEEEVHVLASGSLIQARLLHASGEPAQAIDLLLRWEMRTHFSWSLRAIYTCRARLQLAKGDLSAVEQWAQEKEQSFGSLARKQEEDLPLLRQQEEALLLARLHIAQKRGETALKELACWKEKAQAQGRKRSVLEIQILEALAHVACQENTQARSFLIQALRLAQPEKYQRLFLDEGLTMEHLLKTLLPELREASLVSYVRTLLRAFVQEPGTRHAEDRAPSRKDTLLLEPLSEQEQRVLRLLVAGRSNPEIAHELVISLNTVKTHVQSLYRKLNVHNRVEASEVARRLPLL